MSPSERLELKIFYMLKMIVVATIIFSLIERDWFLFASSLTILVFSALRAIIERRLNIMLPVEVDRVLTTFVFLHFMFGEARQYYLRFRWFDMVVHGSSGIRIGMVGCVIM